MEKQTIRSRLNFDSIAALKPYLSKKGENYLKKRAYQDEKFDERIVSEINSGKVRNMYDFDILIFETSDRLSVFDRVIKEDVPLKGVMLNCISTHNKMLLEELGVKTDLVNILSGDVLQCNQIFRLCGFEVKDFKRLSFAKKLNMFPLEFIVRGYIVGSAWKAYKNGESYCGFTFPDGLKEGQKLETPILTPTTKASTGHDEPVTKEQAIKIVADWLVEEDLYLLSSKDIEEICDESVIVSEEIFDIPEKAKKYAIDYIDYSTDIFDLDDWWDYYELALAYCLAEYYIESIYDLSLYAYGDLGKMIERKGILFIDTKFEFGLDKNGEICMGDEVGTPDSSRFAPKDEYEKTGKIVSIDKQIVRDYCTSIGFTGEPEQEIPEIPDDVWKKVTSTYVKVAKLLCGEETVKMYK